MLPSAPRHNTRRERQIQRKRHEILLAATQVFSEKGYASTTTKDIANAADIGESTLYSYFNSKRDILLSIFSENHLIFDNIMQKSAEIADSRNLAELFEQTLIVFSSHIFLLRTVMTESWTDDEILDSYVIKRLSEISKVIERFIQNQIDAGVFHAFDPVLGARLAMGMFFSLMLPALRGIEPPPTAEQCRSYSEAVVSVMLDGIRKRSGESA